MIHGAESRECPSTGGRLQNGFELRRTPSGPLELKLWGRFPPGWTGALSGGLSRRRIGIIRGHARKVQTSWSAMFELDASRCAANPDSIDFLAMALDDRDEGPATDLSLKEFTLVDSAGALQLEVRATDQLGFLASLLNRLAFLFLFPEEMRIETVDDRAVDRFRLKGIGGTPPSPTARAALERKLQDLVTK